MRESDQSAEKAKAIEKETRAFECPHCGNRFQFIVRVNVVTIKDAQTPEAYRAKEGITINAKKDTLSADEREVVEAARRAGVIDAFAAAVKVKTPPVPPDVDKFFIQFLNTAVRAKSPQFAVRMCLPEDEQSGELEMWTAQGVVAVLADGAFKTFLPKWVVDGKPNPRLEVQGGRPRAIAPDTSLKVWVRTRNGYVEGRGLLFQELKGRAAGSFAKATGNY